MSPLAEKNLRKAANRFGTLPKGARIDAYLESMKRADTESRDDHSAPVSDDSLDNAGGGEGEAQEVKERTR